MIATFGVPGFFAPRIPPAPLWPPGSPQSQSYYDTAPLKKTLERLVDFDRINDLKTRLSVGAVGVTSGNFRLFRQFRVQEAAARRSAPSTSWPPARCRRAFRPSIIEGEHYWDGGIASNTPLDFVLDEEVNRDLLIFQVDLFSARGELPTSLLEAAEREKDIRYSSRTRMNTDKNKQLHNARMAVRDLIGKLPDHLQSDPSVEFLRKAAKENTVTVVHLIYKSKNYEIEFQGLRLLACRHGRTLERGRPRRSSVDASQGCAGAPAIRPDHGGLRYDGGRSQNPRRQTGVMKWVR